MADVHLFSVENNAKTLINYPMSLIASTTSPLQTPHDSSFFFNSFSEHIPDAMETLAWQQLVPDQHLPFSSPLPSLNYALALTLPEMGYDPNHEMGEGALLRDLAFSLDLAKENNTLQAAIIAASPHVAATFSPPENLSSFCNGRSSQLGDYCVGIPDKLAMALKNENMKAFSPPCTAEESGGKTMHPTYQREEEHPEVSCSSGFNAAQKPKNASLKRGTAEKKRKPVEDKITDVPSCITCVHQQAAPKKPKAEEVKIKGHKSSEKIDKAEESKKKAESNSSGNSGSSRQLHANENATQAEPPKQDFIHVRARRGQATDSHSLAERVRREKISERMKVLQDLVPGCSKVSGKAVILDEIINYVQSLQHQVEFLSMKLASVNSRLNISLDGMFRKEMLQGHIIPSPYGFDQELLPNFSLITSAQAKLNQLGGRCTGGLDSMSLISTQGNTAKRSTATMLNSNIFGDVNSQISSVWDELQNPYQIGRLIHDNCFTGKSDFEDQMRAKHLLKTELK